MYDTPASTHQTLRDRVWAMNPDIQWNELYGELAAIWPFYLIAFAVALLLNGLLTHWAAKTMGVEHSTLGKGINVFLISLLIGLVENALFFAIGPDRIQSLPMPAASIVLAFINAVISLAIIMGVFKVSFWKAFFIGVFTFIYALLLWLAVAFTVFLTVTILAR